MSSNERNLASSRKIQGKDLSYNNIADGAAAYECVNQFSSPACVIVKHANPCGVALDDNIKKAYMRAFSTDPTSAFGGIIAFNRLKTLFVFFTLFLSVCILLVLKSRSKEPEIPIALPPQPSVVIKENTIGNIIIIIDDFGYRNDEVSEGFLTLNEDLTFAVIPGHENSKLFARKAHKMGYEVIILSLIHI